MTGWYLGWGWREEEGKRVVMLEGARAEPLPSALSGAAAALRLSR